MSANLYRLFDQKHALLYVGISASAIARLSQHMSDKPWAHEVAHVSVEHYESREEAVEAEREAIRLEKPKHNIVHNRREIENLPTQRSHVRAEVLWVCDACKGPVDDRQGYLHISYRDIRNAEQAVRAWNAKHPGPSYDGGALLTYPQPARWQVHHTACDPEPESTDYAIQVQRARTAAQMLSWTAHLMGKVWIGATDWIGVIQQLLRDLRVETT